MAYDKNIPDVLQLLRLDLGNVDYTVPMDTTIARSAIVGDYFPRYCIADVADDADTMDVRGAIEETMHTILDYGGTPEDLRTAMGLVPEAEIDSDIIESGEYIPVDLGYCLDGQLTSFEVLPLDECDIEDVLNGHQIENVMTALNNLPVNLRLPAAKVLSQGGYTEWQAYQICKAFEVGVDADVIAKRIANPVLNHAQMRELRRIAVHTDFADHDASPYKKDVYKTLSNGEYTAEHLHQARELMKTTAIHDIAFPRDWLKLDSRQMEVVRHALKSDVPMDALEEYADGTYTADHMNVITMALTEGMEKPGIERLMNHDLSMEQVWGFYSAISGGRFTSEQLDVLCDPTKPAEVMNAMRTGMTYGLDTQTVTRFADGTFKPGQMETIYHAAADKKWVTDEILDVIADPRYSANQIGALHISAAQGATLDEIKREKEVMGMSMNLKDDAAKSGSVHEAAKESREASAQLGSESHGDKAVEREELE